MADQNLENLETLITVSRLLSSKLELSDLLLYIMKLAARVVNSERASLYLVDERTSELYFDVALGLPESVQKMRLKPGEGIAGTCYRDGKSIIINDVSADPRHARKVDDESGFVTRSVLACPMVVKGSVIGVVQAINHLDGEYSDRDLKNFEAFASQAAVAIENARLFSAVKEEKRRLQIFFTQTGEAALLADASGNVLLANNAARAYLSGAPEMGAHLNHLFAEMELTPGLDVLLASQEKTLHFDAMRQKPKKLYLEGTAIRLEKQSGPKADGHGGWLLLFRDVTAQRQEEALSRNFLSLVSHKLKTPLTVINGYIGLLSDEVRKGSIQGFPATAVDTIARQEKRLGGLVEQLISYTTIEELDPSALKKTLVPLENALTEAAKLCESSTASLKLSETEPGTLRFAFGPESSAAAVVLGYDFKAAPELLADKELLHGVIAVLVSNAIKFNPKPARSVLLKSAPAEGGIEMTVSDDGPGIPPEEHDRIFQKFYQAEASFTGQVEGWGLGLAYAKKVMEAHGGRITVRSSASGSTFSCFFPS
ncbi:MAG: GAF domain-containing protein [Elusimicrobia bacterium]|nr:GAF domain-containing protein [Elusimicrobiota bacterium]